MIGRAPVYPPSTLRSQGAEKLATEARKRAGACAVTSGVILPSVRPRLRALLAFVVFVIATIVAVSYVFQKRAAIYSLLTNRAGSSPHLTAADLSGSEIDMLAFGCGVERWDIKTLSDDDAGKAIEAEPRQATIRQLLALPPPRWWREAPRFPEEVQHVVDGEILAYKLEPDQDIHVIIGSDHVTMVAEFPSPSCVPRVAARALLNAARNQLLRILPTPPDSTPEQPPEPIPVRIRGVLFFDKSHGQIGGTWNGVELHPVLEITSR